MKKSLVVVSVCLIFGAELLALLWFGRTPLLKPQDTVAVNRMVRFVEEHCDAYVSGDVVETEQMIMDEALEYVVLDAGGLVCYRSAAGLSEDLNAAVAHRDTILDLSVDGQLVGKIIFHNDGEELLLLQRKKLTVFLGCGILLQAAIIIVYLLWISRAVLRPFDRLKGFAERVAGGNLDIPLAMDRHNLFGAFTESFDVMRCELKKARLAEAQANASKKELVAKLSHDIKTPVASIKAVAEVGAALAESDKTRESYIQIIQKADQINTLVSDLFTATLEELQQLTVTPEEMESSQIAELLENADYLHRANEVSVPECLLVADRLRLQQVFDNIFANSYKYADTEITVQEQLGQQSLAVVIEDCGGGVPEEELPLLLEKFQRGSNAKDKEGAGLGLYIAHYFMNEMHGELFVENGTHGLRVTVEIALAGV